MFTEIGTAADPALIRHVAPLGWAHTPISHRVRPRRMTREWVYTLRRRNAKKRIPVYTMLIGLVD